MVLSKEKRFEASIDDFHSRNDPRHPLHTRLRSPKLAEFLRNDDTDFVHIYLDFDHKTSKVECLPTPQAATAFLHPLIGQVLRRYSDCEDFEDSDLITAYRDNRSGAKDTFKLSCRFYLLGYKTKALSIKSFSIVLNQAVALHLADEGSPFCQAECCSNLSPSFDEGIYHHWRAMGMVGKYKSDEDTAVLRKSDPSLSDNFFLISHILPEDTQISWNTLLDSDFETITKARKAEKTETEECDAKDYAPISAYINELREDDVVTKVSKRIDDQDRISFLITTKIKWCPKIKREHTGNYQFATINNTGLSFYCHDVECKKYRYSTKSFSSLPLEIQNLFESTETPIDEEGVRSDVQLFVKSVINDVEQDGVADLDYDLRQIVSLLQPSALLESLSGHTCGNNFTAQIDKSGIKFVCQTCGMTWPKDTTVAHCPASYTKLCDFLHLNINVNSFNNLTNTNIGNVNSTNTSEALIDLSERLRDVTFDDSDLIAANLTDNDQVRCVLMNCLHSVENDTVAELLYVLYSDKLRCLGDREGWYEYRFHRW